MKKSDFENCEAVLSRRGQLVYVSPHGAANRYIAHYTLGFAEEEPKPAFFELIPDVCGCLVYTMQADGADRLLLWGPATQRVTVPNDNHDHPLRLFVEFHPFGLYKLIGKPIKMLENQCIDLREADAELDYKLRSLIRSAKTGTALIQSLDAFFADAFMQHEVDPVCVSLADRVIRSFGTQKVADIAKALYISERQLNRICNKYIGLSVKSFSEVVRINAVVRKVTQNDQAGISGEQDFLDYGFYDHAHYNKLFKSVCGVPPRVYVQAKGTFYHEPYKYE